MRGTNNYRRPASARHTNQGLIADWSTTLQSHSDLWSGAEYSQHRSLQHSSLPLLTLPFDDLVVRVRA